MPRNEVFPSGDENEIENGVALFAGVGVAFEVVGEAVFAEVLSDVFEVFFEVLFVDVVFAAAGLAAETVILSAFKTPGAALLMLLENPTVSAATGWHATSETARAPVCTDTSATFPSHAETVTSAELVRITIEFPTGFEKSVTTPTHSAAANDETMAKTAMKKHCRRMLIDRYRAAFSDKLFSTPKQVWVWHQPLIFECSSV